MPANPTIMFVADEHRLLAVVLRRESTTTGS